MSCQWSFPGMNLHPARGHTPPFPRLPAVNLAVAMSQSLGLRVGLLDADVFGPSVGHMLGLSGKPEIGEGGCACGRGFLTGGQGGSLDRLCIQSKSLSNPSSRPRQQRQAGSWCRAARTACDA